MTCQDDVVAAATDDRALPVPPTIESLPDRRPKMMSLPPPPVIVAFPVPPTIESLPDDVPK